MILVYDVSYHDYITLFKQSQSSNLVIILFVSNWILLLLIKIKNEIKKELIIGVLVEVIEDQENLQNFLASKVNYQPTKVIVLEI